MLGRVTSAHHGRMDDYLQAAARAAGAEDSFGPVPTAIHFGRPGVSEPDPFFDGRGPERTGCRLCGECLLGCPYGAKNELTRNYLHLAEQEGVQIRAEHEVTRLSPVEGGYLVETRHPWRKDRRTTISARRVVLAAGVLGTLELLHRCRDELGTPARHLAAPRPARTHQFRGSHRRAAAAWRRLVAGADDLQSLPTPTRVRT
jgi:cholesterol oxidase